MKRFKIYITGLLCGLPLLLSAQSVELLGLYPVGDAYELKATVDRQSKEIREVAVYAYNMVTGENRYNTDYELIDGRFITATPPVVENASAYRMKVVFDDDTVVLSPCIEPASGKKFMWLGDYAWTDAASGWNTNPPQIDQPVNTRLKLRINDTIYHKGISTHANGHFRYRFEQPFASFKARVGVQQEEINGDVRVQVSTNDALREDFVVFSASNEERGDGLTIRDINLDMSGVSSLYLNINQYDANTWGDHTHFVMSRLYLPEVGSTPKEPQQVVFQTSGGEIAEGTELLTLQASATSGGKIYFRIVKGAELATIVNGNQLQFNYGKAGEIRIEATQYGDDRYACANAVISLHYNSVPEFTLLGSHVFAGEQGDELYAYFYIDTKQKPLERLVMHTFNNALQLTPEAQIDLMPYLKDTDFGHPQVIEIPFESGKPIRFAAGYPAQSENVWITPYYENGLPYEYVSDMNNFRYGTGYGSVSIDKAFGNNDLINLCGQTYAKGFGIHADGWMEATIEAGRYARFVADAGKQRGRPGNMEVNIAINGQQTATSGIINANSKASWDYTLADTVTRVRINLLTGGDGNGSDHGAIGAPRFYHMPATLRSQEITWQKSHTIHRSRPFTTQLTASSTSQLPIFYRILKGNRYAAISGDNQLDIHTVPDQDTIVVEAFQPGNNEWAPAAAFRSSFYVTKGRIVQKDERIELENGEDLEELTVYGDATSIGQVTVKSGLVKVKRLIFKYTFNPRDWNFIAFPTSLNIAQISNLEELGYSYNGREAGKGAYYIRSYNTQKRAQNPTGSSWEALKEPVVEGLKGYIMGINAYHGEHPREVTFTINNVSFDFESTVRLLNLTIDMTHAEPGTKVPVYISPENAKGNTLKVEVNFQPDDTSVLPVNHQRALEEARITFTPNREGIRLTLPDQSPAKVVIFDRRMKRVIKAVRYTAPMMIDISDLQKGTYRVLISYGNATTLKELVR